jgi:hypothetical protein
MSNNQSINEFDIWTPWYDFGDIFEYWGLPDQTNTTKSKEKVTTNGVTGFLHTDNGFRLRSKGKYASFQKIELKTPLSERHCPLMHSDIGVYWVKIELPNQERYDYIGQCAELKDGIRKRLTNHFSKMIFIEGLNVRKYTKATEKFKNFYEKVTKDLNIEIRDPEVNFFDKYVQIRFVRVKPSNNGKKIHRIEGMALQKFRIDHDSFPRLNDKNETIGMEGF